MTSLACGFPLHLGDLVLIGPLLGACYLALRHAWHRLTCRRKCLNHKHKEHPHP